MQSVTAVACSENRAKLTEPDSFDTPNGDGSPDKTLNEVLGAARLLDCACNQTIVLFNHTILNSPPKSLKVSEESNRDGFFKIKQTFEEE